MFKITDFTVAGLQALHAQKVTEVIKGVEIFVTKGRDKHLKKGPLQTTKSTQEASWTETGQTLMKNSADWKAELISAFNGETLSVEFVDD
ncbi:hypothetical protein BTVI_55986 [Pitangus sulphuratus]|nr:hypothetical protein BTVI_90290 [Pitangus sulphuratus]KAJ7409675.1 hypothetical protein BTVI_55986 [Pitangus sulphuratus]